MNRILGWMACMLMLACLLSARAETAGHLASWNGKRAGVITGNFHDQVIREAFPDSPIDEYNNHTDLIAALKGGKIDYFLLSTGSAAHLMEEEDSLLALPEPVKVLDIAAMFPKTEEGEALKAQMDEFLSRLKQDGTLDEITRFWDDPANASTPLSTEGLSAENGTLRFATGGTKVPYSYIAEGQSAGTDPDIAIRFCREYGYGIDISIADLGGILPGIATGMYDFSLSDFAVTEERKESVLFSEPYRGTELLLIVRREDAEQSDLTREDLNAPGRKIGVSTGSASMLLAEKELSKAQILYYEDFASPYQAVADGKIDAFVFDRRQMEIAIENGRRGVHLLNWNLEGGVPIAVGVSPVTTVPDLLNRVNAFIGEIRENGILDDMYRRWVIDRIEVMPEIERAQNPRIHLKVGTTGTNQPYTYYTGSSLTGYDIELAYRFAAFIGADLEFKVYDYGGIINAAAAGDVDCVMANLNITEERAEVMPFSDALYEEKVGIMVRGEVPGGAAENSASENGEEGFWESIRTSFGKTFLRENRWQLFVRGTGITMLITVLSILFGTMLGFAVFMLCRNGNKAANGIARVCMGLVRGMPMVVLLMILYYVVFASVAVSGVFVAVIGFTLTFASAVFGLLKMGTGAVDPGQYEAAYALGYSNRRTFFRIILPQALPHVMGAFRGETFSLIKATAIVGYIAVQDLTKMGDIVRSRTYEALFPLIAVTVIYFVLEGLLALAVSRLAVCLNPRRRSAKKILKGVKTDDPN